MRTVQLEHETDLEGWRAAARALRLAEVPPDAVTWQVGEGTGLFSGEPPPQVPPDARFTASREFLALAGDLICHRSAERFDLLYRLLWRLRDEPQLARIVTDPQVARAVSMQQQVRHAEHKMHAFVRFRLVDEPAPNGRETYVAWFEPPHHVVERGSAFFVRRMANLNFSILTPDVCAHWDGEALSFTPGAQASAAPGGDVLEDYWRTYFVSVFNPARVNPALMRSHMPKRYWRNLPEAAAIPDLVEQAEARAQAMVQSIPSVPSEAAKRVSARARTPDKLDARAREVAEAEVEPDKLEDIAAGVQVCRRCDLWRDATQGVPGEGPRHAPLMFVGEQPGDQEDLAGHPFVGPAGKVLDKALAEAGVPRDAAFVTNAVKHFKHEMKGPRRQHRTPDKTEVAACRWWLKNEQKLVRPKVIVALGGTAASSVLGRPVAVMKERGPAGEVDGAQAFVTIHPSMLLRIPDKAAKAKAYDDFVRDLKAAYALLQAA